MILRFAFDNIPTNVIIEPSIVIFYSIFKSSPERYRKKSSSRCCCLKPIHIIYYEHFEKKSVSKNWEYNLSHKAKFVNFVSVLSLDGQHRNQIDYILCSQRWRSSLQSAKTRPGAVAQIMNSLLPNSELNWIKWGKPLDHSGMT